MDYEDKLKDELEKRGWKPTHYLREDKWVSPYSLIEYEFEQAVKIEDLEMEEP